MQAKVVRETYARVYCGGLIGESRALRQIEQKNSRLRTSHAAPRLEALDRPTVRTAPTPSRRQKLTRPLGAARAQQAYHQRILDEIALGATATDALVGGHDSREFASRRCPVRAAEGGKRARKRRHHVARRTLGALNDPGQCGGITRKCMRERTVHIRKGDAGRWKPLRGVPAKLPPQLGLTRLPRHLRAQQERGTITERVDGRSPRSSGPQVRAIEAPCLLSFAERQLPERDVPCHVTMQQTVLRVVSPPVLQVGQPRFALTGLVIDVGANVRAMGIARITRQRTLNGGARTLDLAHFHLREGVRAGEPPVLAIGVGEGRKECQELRLAT